MRRALRVINVLVWLAAWIGIAYSLDAFGHPLRLLGDAISPAILCIAIDAALRGRRMKNSN